MIQPFFFGQDNEKLFGFIHPAKQTSTPRAVLLCYPLGQEYLRIYRSFKLLANQLSAKGANVMRFDYFGTGDSSGTSEECNFETLSKNIHDAIDHLKQQSGSSKVSIVSVRLGSSLAAQTSAERDDIENLIMIDPVLNGQDYISKLNKTHHEMLVDPDRFSQPRKKEECKTNEILGFMFSDRFMQDVTALNEESLTSLKCQNLFVVNSNCEDVTKNFCNKSLVNASNVDYEVIETPIRWTDVSRIEKTITLQDIGPFIIRKLTT